jgi:hypothetical protein
MVLRRHQVELVECTGTTDVDMEHEAVEDIKTASSETFEGLPSSTEGDDKASTTHQP